MITLDAERIWSPWQSCHRRDGRAPSEEEGCQRTSSRSGPKKSTTLYPLSAFPWMILPTSPLSLPRQVFYIYKIAIKDGHCLEGQSKFEQLSEILTKVENILTHWSVAQTCAVLNDEKNGGRKSLWTVPLIVLFCVFTWASPCLAAVSALLRPVRPP